MFSPTVVILILGSHVNHLLRDRVQMATNYYYENQDEDISFYISGGIKHAIETESEAYIATNFIQNMSIDVNNENTIMIDDEAKNTAENFRNFRCKFYNPWLNKPKLIISTSRFHYKRAKLFFDSYFPNESAEWLLGEESCYYCKNDENIYIKNVKNDIEKASLEKCFYY